MSVNNKLIDYYKVLRHKNLNINRYLYSIDNNNDDIKNVKNVSIKLRGNISSEYNGVNLSTFKSFDIFYNNNNSELLSYISSSITDYSISEIINSVGGNNDTDVYYFKNLDIDNTNFLPASNGNGKFYLTRLANINNFKISTLQSDNRNNTLLEIKQNNTGLGFSSSVNAVIYNNEIYMKNKFPSDNNNTRNYIINYSDIKFNTQSNNTDNFSFDISNNSKTIDVENYNSGHLEFPNIVDASRIDEIFNYEENDFFSAAYIDSLDITNGTIKKFDSNNYVIAEYNTDNIETNERNNFANLGIIYSLENNIHSLKNESEQSQSYNNIILEVDSSESKRNYIFKTTNEFNEYTNSTTILSFGGAKYNDVPNSFIFSEYGNNRGIEFDIHNYNDGEIRTDGIMHITVDKLQEVEITTTTTEASTTR